MDDCITRVELSPDELSLREAHHRITNSLGTISGLVRQKARNANAGDVREFLLDVAVRIDTVAKLHRLLSRANDGRVPVAEFLSNVLAATQAISGEGERIKLTLECPPTMSVGAQTALHLGLLAGELMSNAIKYAHPTGVTTSVRIDCRRDDDEGLTFSFEDDGIGFPEDFDPATDGGLGMTIIDSVCRQMRGRHSWIDSGIGLRFTCRIPGPESHSDDVR
jgi:two-component sensor histidine kinase